MTDEQRVKEIFNEPLLPERAIREAHALLDEWLVLGAREQTHHHQKFWGETEEVILRHWTAAARAWRDCEASLHALRDAIRTQARNLPE